MDHPTARHAAVETTTAALRREVRDLRWFLLVGTLLVGLGALTAYAATSVDRHGERTRGVVADEKV